MKLGLIVSLLIAVGTAWAEPERESPDWWATTEETSAFTATCEDGSIELKVRVAELDNVVEKTVKTPDGDVTESYHQGKRLPADFWIGQKALTRFDLYWKGKKVPIKDRFWRDIYGLRIMTTTVDPATVADADRGSFEEFLSALKRPRVVLSTDGGTVLIEWKRSEDCDSQSTFRWIVTRDGTVLRHHDHPPCDC